MTEEPQKKPLPLSGPGEANATVLRRRIGKLIGPFKLLTLLGEGAFGVVYLAEQKQPVRRRVALKLIKLGMDSERIIARFEAERQALALMDHPNIAKVLDAGTTEAGRPYFVMEFVKGESFIEHCDRKKLDIEKRLQLFLQVCEAVQHAHQKGIIHRDIKPSNILVSVQGNKAIPKIIDFGIAKAISQPLTERTLFTEQGQLLGTPEYMSPEQAELTSQDIDTRSDIYSLGVLLYELLSGTLPFDSGTLRKGAFDDILRTIRDEDPPRPSTRLLDLGEKAKKVAESRHTEIATLTKRLHKELEWIPLKAMRKEPNRRYKTASELADDVQNYLNGNPLIAGPESVTYRFKKFAHKHTGPLISIAAVLSVLIIGFAVSTKLYLHAEKNAAAYRHELYVNYIAQSQNALRDENYVYAFECLKKCPHYLRGWEWYHLSHVIEQSYGLFKGHSKSVLSVAISNDGSKIASGSADHTIKLWDTEDGKELQTFEGHSNTVQCVIFDVNATRIISGSSDRTIKIWDSDEGNVKTLKGHTEDVTCLAVSPDDKKIISGSLDDTIKIWDAISGEELETIFDHKNDITCLAVSGSDSKKIISGSRDQTILVRNASDGKTSDLKYEGEDVEIESLALSPDESHLISGDHRGFIRIWDLKKQEVIKELKGHSNVISAVEFSSDGKHIVSASYDRCIKIWTFDSNNIDSTKIIAECIRPGNTITTATFTPDDEQVIWGSMEGKIGTWDIEADSKIEYTPLLYKHTNGISSVAVSPVDNCMAVGTIDDSIVILDAGNLSKVKEWKHGTEIDTLKAFILRTAYGITVTFSPDGKRVVSGSIDGTVKIWDRRNGSELRRFTEHKDWIASLAFSPDGKLLVSGSGDATLKIWGTAGNKSNSLATFGGYQKKEHETFKISYPACAAFGSDGKIVSGGPDGTLKIWDIKGNLLSTMKGQHSDGIISVSFSPDNAYVVSGSLDNNVKLWSTDDWSEIRSLTGHTHYILSVSFSPDSKRIISSSMDETVKIWDPSYPSELITLRGHNGPVKTAIFSPDGKDIITGSLDRKLYIWESIGSR